MSGKKKVYKMLVGLTFQLEESIRWRKAYSNIYRQLGKIG